EFDGPGAMRHPPEMLRMRAPEALRMREQMEPLMRERMEPMMRERMEPLLRQRLNDFPTTIKLRSPTRTRTLAPLRGGVYKVDRGDDEAGMPSQFENEIEQIPPEEIRELVAITIQDARAALKQLAAAQIA
ncbi:MAG: hypothetical protein ABJB95_04725, partial [Gemmatimonadales bacterium]